MSNVVEFSPFEADAPALPHRRLLLLSRSLKYLLSLLLVLFALNVLIGIATALFFGSHIVMGSEGTKVIFSLHGQVPRAGPGEVRMSDLPAITRLAGAVGWLIVSVPLVFIFWHLRGLFGLYARGIVFATQNALHLKRIGLWLIAYPFANYVCNALFWLAGGADKASWFHLFQVQALVLGAIVYAIAQVMEFGREIEQEKDSFI
ncbi:MAG TPA: DUF2975 domain-containing protein [Rhizomicrobium sp.]